MREDLRTDLETQGFRIEKAVVTPSAVEELASAFGHGVSGDGSSRRGSSAFGVRNLLSSVPAARRLAA